MKYLKFLPFTLILFMIACSDSGSGVEKFIGEWELSHFSWNDCENSGVDRSISIDVPLGGCFFDGCISMIIADDGTASLSLAEEGEEPWVTEVSYVYNESEDNILLKDADSEYEGLISISIAEDELVIPYLEDGCDAEYRMRKR